MYRKWKNGLGKPSEQIRCSDWTAAQVLDDAVSLFGNYVDSETERYASHRVPVADGKTEPMKPEDVDEYHRALVEGTPFVRVRVNQRKKKRRPPKGAT